MRGVLLSPKAHSDVAEIRRYTLRTWGRDQAHVYLKGLGQRIRQIARGEAPTTKSELGYDRVRYRSHNIYFIEEGDGIRIERIIHTSMDAASQLGDEAY